MTFTTETPIPTSPGVIFPVALTAEADFSPLAVAARTNVTTLMIFNFPEFTLGGFVSLLR